MLARALVEKARVMIMDAALREPLPGPQPVAEELRARLGDIQRGQLLHIKRAHWGIENGLHWGLDVAMREDDARNRKDHGPANIAALRRRARDLVALDEGKGSLAVKLKRAGWDEDYRLKLLGQMR